MTRSFLHIFSICESVHVQTNVFHELYVSFPAVLEVDLHGGNDQLLEKELATVASHISDWEQLAHALNVAECVRNIQDMFRRSKVECCTQMLRVWYHNYENGGWEETAREHLTQQLKKAGYVGVATFLETG